MRPQRLLLLPLLLVLSACAALGLQQPKSFEERYAYEISQTTGVRDSCTQSLEEKLITVADMDDCIVLTDRSRNALKLARQAHEVGDLSTAEARLTLAMGVLDELETFLATRVKR